VTSTTSPRDLAGPLHRGPGSGRPDLPELLRRVQGGRPGAVNAFLQASRPLIAGVARGIVPAAADVDDVVQEVSLKLVQHADRIRNPEAIAGWIRRVARNEAVTHRRRNGRATACDSFDDLESEDRTEDLALSGTARTEIGSAVTEAVERLRPHEVVLVKLLFASDKPDYRAISEQTGRPLGSIGPTRQRLLGRLRKDLSVRPLGPETAPAPLPRPRTRPHPQRRHLSAPLLLPTARQPVPAGERGADAA
jgi:RNA polymerase sigma factor (sigma-70 family)